MQLTDLEVIQQFSLAVRGATASRAAVVAALRRDLAWLAGSADGDPSGAVPDPARDDVPEPAGSAATPGRPRRAPARPGGAGAARPGSPPGGPAARGGPAPPGRAGGGASTPPADRHVDVVRLGRAPRAPRAAPAGRGGRPGRAGRAAGTPRGPPGMSALPWPAGTATGIGSLPGTDPAEAARLVLGELPDLPFLPELPARGPVADLAGRTCALLVDLPVDLQPGGWRLVERPGRDLSRARDALARDLDALEEVAAAAPPARVKVQAAGPWTLAALLELRGLERVLSDPGAVRDLAASLAEGLTAHVADVRRRLPGAQVLLQLDEPSLPAVLTAGIPTSSGYATLRAPAAQVVAEHLSTVLAACPDTVVHCCAPRPPVELLRRAGAGSLSLDATLLREADDDAVGEAVEAGLGLLLGCVPTSGPPPAVDAVLQPVRRLWRRLGLAPEQLPRTVVVTPTCGLAGAAPVDARALLSTCVRAARALEEEPA